MKPQVANDLSKVIPEIENVFNNLRADYTKWQNACDVRRNEVGSHISAEMIEEYNKGLTYEVGGKFIKLISSNRGSSTVLGFVVISDGAKWKSGDLLKAASWKAPAQNFKRGNIFEPATYENIRWTGIG